MQKPRICTNNSAEFTLKALLFSGLILIVFGRDAISIVKPPVNVLIFNEQGIETNKPLNFTIKLKGELNNVRLDFVIPEGWTYAGGHTVWEGDLTLDKQIEWTVTLIPTVPSPIMPYGVIKHKEWGEVIYKSYNPYKR